MLVESRVEALHQRFQPIAQAWLEVVQAYVLPLRFPDFKCHIVETLRPRDRQEQLASSGASKVSFGWHNVGLAFDFQILDADGKYITDGGHPAYMACGQIGEAFNCVWGGRWEKFVDAGHLEYHPGFTLQQYVAAHDLGTDLAGGLKA